MKILIIHSQQPLNQYAGDPTGLGDSEQYRMRPLAARIVDGLRAAGHEALLGPLGTSYRDNVAWCNRTRGDLIVSCHSNATGTSSRGTGALIGIGSDRARPAAEAIAGELGKVVPGGASITDADWIKVSELVDTYDPACLVEYYWHDKSDQAEWIRQNWPAMADATVRGLVGRFGGGVVVPPLAATTPAMAPADLIIRLGDGRDLAWNLKRDLRKVFPKAAAKVDPSTPWWGQDSKDALATIQRNAIGELGLTGWTAADVDGVPGPKTWLMLARYGIHPNPNGGATA